MPRTTKPLTDTEIRQAKPKDREYSLSDGKQLAVRIKVNNSKLWTFNYYRPGTKKRTNISFGTYPDVTLANARKKAEEFRRVLRDGIDPKEYRLEAEREQNRQRTNTFEHVCKKWLELKKGDVSEAYYKKVVSRLEKYIYPRMGRTPIQNINAPTTIDIIKPIADDEKYETVKKLCRWINQVMEYAVNTGYIHANPLSGIGKTFKAPTVTNMPSITPQELPELMYSIQHSTTKQVTRCLLEWQLHTMVRPKEAAEAKWDEIDEDKMLWTIPAERMKKRHEHVVPLSPQAMRLLQTIKPLSGHRPYIFPNDHAPLKPANSQSTNRALIRMGYKGRLVAHGLRALASTTLNEKGFEKDLIEKALAHVDTNAIRAAYNRAQYLERRREMMNWWSGHIQKCAAGIPVDLSNTV